MQSQRTLVLVAVVGLTLAAILARPALAAAQEGTPTVVAASEPTGEICTAVPFENQQILGEGNEVAVYQFEFEPGDELPVESMYTESIAVQVQQGDIMLVLDEGSATVISADGSELVADDGTPMADMIDETDVLVEQDTNANLTTGSLILHDGEATYGYRNVGDEPATLVVLVTVPESAAGTAAQDYPFSWCPLEAQTSATPPSQKRLPSLMCGGG